MLIYLAAVQKPSQERDLAMQADVARTKMQPLGRSGSPLLEARQTTGFLLSKEISQGITQFLFLLSKSSSPLPELPLPGGLQPTPSGGPRGARGAGLPPSGQPRGRRPGMAERPYALTTVGAGSPAPCPAHPATSDLHVP